MDFTLTREQQDIVAKAQQVAMEHLEPRAAHYDETASHPIESWHDLWENGLLAMAVPEKYGGLGLDMVTYVMVIEKLAQGCTNTAMTVHMHSVVQRYIDALATPEQKSYFYPDQMERFLARIDREWGRGMSAKLFARSIAHDEQHVRSWGRFERLAVSPGAARTLLQMAFDSDVRHVLPSIHVPTLVLHRSGDPAVQVGGARYMAERIPGAKYVEFPGIDHFPWTGDVDAILDETEEFLTGARHGPEPDRVLVTVLFTDIVGATERAVELGDRQWRDLLARHHSLVRRELTRFRGQEVDTAGDSFFATFDGPARAIRCACAIQDACQVQIAFQNLHFPFEF